MANISVFIPHEGCPHRCSFCNQNVITGRVSADDVKRAVDNAGRNDAEIAFFGGSFTCIEKDYMISLLNAAQNEVDNGRAKGIRMSTRPDGITPEIIEILKNYTVSCVELGAQSMVDEVLEANHRGHNALCVENAVRLLQSNGFSVGLQMMTGLYKSTYEKDIYTAKKIIELNPSCVRIYPTVVVKDTLLARLYNNGEYTPLTLNEAVSLCADVLSMFLSSNINVIRVGLHEVESFIAGPFHPAFGELTESEVMRRNALLQLKEPGNYKIFVAKNFISKMIGQHRINIEILSKMGYNCKVYEKELNPFEVVVQKEV